jgi:hypothetical protein
MKEVNLISFIDAYTNLSKELFDKYKEYYSIDIKRTKELGCLSGMINEIKTINQNIEIFDRFFIGFKIPQIGKEFDLLRFDDDSIINIELKTENTKEKIKEQLEKNKYYLNFLNKNLLCFTYILSENKFYEIGQNNDLNEVSTSEVVSKLIAQNSYIVNDIKSFFNPSDYLVSPFNSTDKFIKEYYFLTEHQKNIKTQVVEEINNPNTSIISIQGKAGTGKTLLIYDIAKEIYKKKEEVLIIHCGYLNEGQSKLTEDYDWYIVPIKDALQQDFSKYKLVIIDETQRIYPKQFYEIIKKVKQNNSNCIISFDGEQTLSNKERNNNIPQKIDEVKTHLFKLTDKIRTNKNVADFIEMLFNRNIPYSGQYNQNIEFSYFNDLEKVKEFIEYLKANSWKVINYTPQTYGSRPPHERFYIWGELNSHEVIGQEFDNVVAVIDESFHYNSSGFLETKNNTYYHLVKMLFQIMTRAKLKIHLVIYKNEEILERCLQILK